MYIKKNYEEEEITNAIDANSSAMDLVYNVIIEPFEKELTEEQGIALAIAGSTFKIIAQKAYAYEQLQKGKDLQN
jgi:hypothetical protein